MYKIQTLNNISPVGLERFARDRYEVASEIQHADAIMLRSYNMHDMKLNDTVKAIGRAGAGVNNIPVASMTEKGIPVFNAPGANANAVKELVVAGMLLAARNICQAWNYASNLQGLTKKIHKQTEAGKKNYGGFELPGRALGVVGLGAIGIKVANVTEPGNEGGGLRSGHNGAKRLEAIVRRAKANSIDDLLSRVDFVTFHVPLVDATRNMINADRLRNMRDGVTILNFARNGIVDDEAVCAAIKAGKVNAYICDFPSNLLMKQDRVITLPHLGASTKEAEDNCAIMIADQLKDFLENGNITNSVNFPEVYMSRNGGHRLSVVNSNVPNMLGQISTALAGAGLNIIDMLNKSRGDIAYTLVDVESEVPEAVLSTISSIKGVLSARLV